MTWRLAMLVAAGLYGGVARAETTDVSRFEAMHLDIDDCRPVDSSLTPEAVKRQVSEHYERGATLYQQGDYPGSVTEFVAGYCLIPYYSLLKDIGQAYERALDYEQAVGYLARFVSRIPADAKPANACAPDPQVDKENVKRRIEVLAKLRGQLLVESVPANAKITLLQDGRVASRATSGEPIDIERGHYDVLVERDGFDPVQRSVDIKIGKPLAIFLRLEEQTGQLVVQVQPPEARLFIDNRLVGIGSTEQTLKAGSYKVMSEAKGRITDERRIDVLPKRINRLQIELAPQPQFGRRQLLLFTTIGGGLVAGNLLAAFDDPLIGTLGGLAGLTVGGIGAYLYLPETVTLGTSNLTITSALAGAATGFTAALAFSDKNEVIQPITGVGAIGGTVLGYYVGNRTRISPGDAALINSSVIWGTAAGGLFALSFDSDKKISAGLVGSGLVLGLASGIVATRSFDISRTHAALIDVGGLVGIFGGLALVGFIYPDEADKTRNQEHFSNFALGGMAIGLVTSGILTRNYDAPKISVSPTVNRISNGTKTTTTLGFAGRW